MSIEYENMAGAIPSTLRDEPASHRLVYLLLANAEVSHSSEEVASQGCLSAPTAKAALATLQRYGLVEAEEHPVDGRRKLYTLADGPETTPPTETPA
jgi:DNA-binding IscR family transcriptional regulator